MGKTIVGCMHLNLIRYDDWEITCKDCGADLSDSLPAVAHFVPDSFMRKWYDYPPTPTSTQTLKGEK